MSPACPQDLAAPHGLTVPASAAGARLDQTVAQLLPHHSRNRLKGWIEAGQVSVNGAVVTSPRHKLRGGETVVVVSIEAPNAAFVAQPIALSLLYEDAALLVVDKPAGLVVHPGSGNRDGTLLNALVHHAPALAALPRAGIVHRLDKDTSGLLVVAKTGEAQTDLVRQLGARTVKREYLALVHGDVARAMTVDAPIDATRSSERRWRWSLPASPPARTWMSSSGSAASRCCAAGSRPAARTRFAFTSRRSVTRWSATPRIEDGAKSACRCRMLCKHSATGAARAAPGPRASGHPRGDAMGSGAACRFRGTHGRAARAPPGGAQAVTARLVDELAARRLDWIVPAWNGPARVQALFTTRTGATSAGVTATLDVLPSEPVWLVQVHGRDVVEIDEPMLDGVQATRPRADAAVTRVSGVVLAVQTADCLPVLFADRAGSVIAVAHAGWRGLAAGVLEATLAAMRVPAADLRVWLGPAIGPRAFEVGPDVYARIATRDPRAHDCFSPLREGKVARGFARSSRGGRSRQRRA
jgi:YfiH family protein